MSFLEELKKQAEEMRAGQPPASTDALGSAPVPQPLEPEHWRKVLPRMRLLEKYLQVLATQALQVGRAVKRSYAVSDWGELQDLSQADHHVVVSGDGSKHEVRFEFSYVGDCPLRFWTTSRSGRDARWEYLDTHQLKYQLQERDKTYFNFVVAPTVPVSLVFQIDPNRSVLRLTATNLERLGRSVYSLEPDAIDARLLDELAKRILARANHFEEMTGYRLSVDVRKQFRRAIAARKLEQDVEANAERKGSLSGLLGTKAR